MKKNFFYLLTFSALLLSVSPNYKASSNAISKKVVQQDTCSVTVNFYNNGRLVGTQTYTGYPCGLFGQNNCKQWRQDMLRMINQQVSDSGTMVPGGGGFTC